MDRILVDRISGGTALLPADQSHHLVHVLRHKEGDEFEIISRHGGRFLCLLRREGRDWVGEIIRPIETEMESNIRLTLVQALIKREKFEWVLQKAVELGVNEIFPVTSCRTEVRLDEKRERRKVERWSKIVEEAVKQSSRGEIPVLHEPLHLEEAIHCLTDRTRIVFDAEGNLSLSSVLEALPTSALDFALFVGPEGGWDEHDRSVFERNGLYRVRIGPRVLRAETAAITALALIQFSRGDLGTVANGEASR